MKDHQKAVHTTSANNEGTIGWWKREPWKNYILEDHTSSLCVALLTFTEDVSRESAVFRASKALQKEINSKEKCKVSLTWMLGMIFCLWKPWSKIALEVNSVFPLAQQTKLTQFYNENFLLSNSVLMESRMTNLVPSTMVSWILSATVTSTRVDLSIKRLSNAKGQGQALANFFL